MLIDAVQMGNVESAVWIVSADPDKWLDSEEFESKESAIVYGPVTLALSKGDKYYVGRRIPASIPCISSEENLDALTDMAVALAGDDACAWLQNVTHQQADDLEIELNIVFMRWLEKNGFCPNWSEVDDIEEHVVSGRILS